MSNVVSLKEYEYETAGGDIKSEVRSLCQTYSLEAAQVLMDVASDEDAPTNARVTAATAILDRALGKPTQAMEHSGNVVSDRPDFSKFTDDELDALRIVAAATRRHREGN